MPPRDWGFRVQDILDAIDGILRYSSGMNFEEFIGDRRTVDGERWTANGGRRTVDAVVRNFIVIGEAAARIPEDVQRGSKDLPWADLPAMRNFVVHEYFGVSDSILWNTIQEDLPGVLEPLRRLLGSDSA